MQLPTTGSWGGSVLSSIFKIRIKEVLFGVFIGRAIAGAIMLTVSMHVTERLSIEMLLMALVTISIGLYTFKKKQINNKRQI